MMQGVGQLDRLGQKKPVNFRILKPVGTFAEY